MDWIHNHAYWLVLLALWPLLHGLGLLMGVLAYRQVRLQAGDFRQAERAELPADARTVLDALQPELAALGFARVGCVWSDSPVVQQPQRAVGGDLYRHANGSWAVAIPLASGVGHALGTVEWLTCFADGQNWAGLNGQAHLQLPAPPHWRYIDASAPGWAASWQAYAAALADAPAAVVDAPADLLLARVRQLRQDFAPYLASQGWAVPVAPGRWQLTWRAALCAVRRIRRGQAAAARATAALPGSAPDSPAYAQARQASELLFFAQQQAVLAAQRAARQPHRTFWVSAALFVAVGVAFFSWQTALVLLAVVALHEGGHWLAMRLMGWRRPSVFFIPGLGGIAMGEKDDATPLQKVVMYLAGPVPGLLLALAAFTLVDGWLPGGLPRWATALMVVTLVINYLNLLPLVPLDGGRVVETLLFARWPRARLAFALLGIGALAAAAWFMRDGVLAAFAALLVMALPWQWRTMQLECAVRRTYPQTTVLDATSAAHQLFAALQQPRFANWPLAQRVVAARNLLPALQSPLPRWPHMLLGGLLYLACLALPLGVILLHPTAGVHAQRWLQPLWGDPRDEDSQAYATRRAAKIEAKAARAATLPVSEQVQVLLDAADELHELGDHDTPDPRVRSLVERAWHLVRNHPPHDLLRARTLLALANGAAQQDERTRLHQQLAADLQGAPAPLGELRADALESLVDDPPPEQTPGQRLALQHQAVQLRSASATDTGRYQVAYSRQRLARLLDRAGHPQAALTQLHANVLAAAAAAAADTQRLGQQGASWLAYRQMESETLQAWFLLDHGDPSAALDRAHQAVARSNAEMLHDMPWALRDALRVQLWAAIELVDADAVRATLQQQAQLRPHASGNGRLPRYTRTERLDQLAAAQLLGDQALRQQAVQALQPDEAVGSCRADGMCQKLRQPDALREDWQNRARDRQRAAAAAAGLCG